MSHTNQTSIEEKCCELPMTNGLEEDVVWRREFAFFVSKLPRNVIDIWHYGLTKMLNNAIDHSGGDKVIMTFKQTILTTDMTIFDNGKGIFKHIQETHHLEDEKHAILELSKGKLTTDPDNHTGEGIFFTSKMFDDFMILSNGVFFSPNPHSNENWIIENERIEKGTMVFMKLHNNTTRTDKEIFDQFALPDEDYQFAKTIVPVRLLRYDNEKLVSRSQAKRLMARVDCFQVVLLDFYSIDTIGQAFADEIFRVFAKSHADIKIVYINANEQVIRMIKRALG